MRLSIVIITTLLMQVSASSLAQHVTLKEYNINFREAFTQIRKQTGYIVLYKSNLINKSALININLEKTPLKDALKVILKGQNVDFEIKQKSIILSKKEDVIEPVKGKSQNEDVKGKILDQSGKPIPSVSILIKGTNKGTTSDTDGNFSLSLATGENEIIISAIGFESQTITINSQINLKIILKEASSTLNELVVVGYGTQKKSDVTGSVSSLKGSELASAPSASADQALQGRVSGVMVQNNSGAPAGDVQIRIRGANSLTYGNNPLVIIDGIQGGNISSLNPNDVLSIEVLKDAAALSVYGSRGANGVILVTTKGGKKGRREIAYNGYTSIDKVRRMLPAIGAQQYATLVNEARTENGLGNLFQPNEIANMGTGTNWQKEIFKQGISQNHNLSINGAQDSVSYFISAGLVDKKGVVLNTGFKQYRLRANLTAQVTPKLSIGLNSFFSYDISKNGDYANAIAAALQWSPIKAIYDNNGKYTQPGGGIGPISLYNPVAVANEIVDESFNSALNIAPRAEYKFNKDLKLSSQFAFIQNSNFQGYFDNQVANEGPASRISGSVTQERYLSLQNTNVITYTKKIKDHDIQFTGVYEIYQDQLRSSLISALGVPINLGYNGLSFGTTFRPPYVALTKTARQSFMGRINYSYKNKYLISFSDRYDGASQLADGHKFENFMAVSFGWNLMEESFMKNLKPVFSDLKIRGSYGQVGNAAVPAYSSQFLFYSGLDASNNPTLRVSQLANPNLTWERTSETNIGIDGAILNRRINFSVEYYNKQTTDLLMFSTVPAATGVQSVLKNVGAVSNKGVDISIDDTPIKAENFKWQSNLTFNYNRNRIEALDGLSDTLYAAGNADYPGLANSFAQMKGQPMGTFLGYTFLGVWKQGDEGLTRYGAKPGDAKYQDLNNDGKIDGKDISVIGSAQPKYIFGWNNTFSYKQFDLNIFVQGVAGNKVYNQNRIRREAYTADAFPTSPVIANHYTVNNQNTDVPAFTGFEYLNSSRWVESGSYLRVKNISLSYRLPSSILKKTKLSAFKVYASATNLFTITKYSGFDPEASIGVDAVAAGVDRSLYPSIKSYTIGLDVSF